MESVIHSRSPAKCLDKLLVVTAARKHTAIVVTFRNNNIVSGIILDSCFWEALNSDEWDVWVLAVLAFFVIVYCRRFVVFVADCVDSWLPFSVLVGSVRPANSTDVHRFH